MTKKLIEVALPLEAINVASAREKSIRHGHPSTLHLWWARRPLAACRAVLFASIVDDPGSRPDLFPTAAAQETERERLFDIIRELVKWENSNDPRTLEAARREINKATGGVPLAALDPFSGGGSIPLEAQRLGLQAHGSDLNPVAVLIGKALIEIPPRFAGRAPVNPVERAKDVQHEWTGARGLAADVRFYGQWMREEAQKRIGKLYPKVLLESGQEATVIAWLWARVVACPNPACRAQMPLVRSFALSTKTGKKAWVEPIVERPQSAPEERIIREQERAWSEVEAHAATGEKPNRGDASIPVRVAFETKPDYVEAPTPHVRFEVKTGDALPPEGTVDRRGARCLCCGQKAPLTHVRAEGMAGRMGAQLMAIVAEGQRGRIYLSPNQTHIEAAQQAKPEWRPDCELPRRHRNFQTPAYGLPNLGDLFTNRQLVALTTFSDLAQEARAKVVCDAQGADWDTDKVLSLSDGGSGPEAYADAVVTYLALTTDKSADYWTTICSWHNSKELIRNTFARQAIAMTWDFAETNPISDSAGNFRGAIKWTAEALESWAVEGQQGQIIQRDVTMLKSTAEFDCASRPIISTDPPYYDNISYADLSDFFYVWLRRSLKGTWPSLFSTLLVPKTPELISAPYRFDGDKHAAKAFFENGLGDAFRAMREVAHPDYPLTVFYAFKQSETESDDTQSTLVGDESATDASTQTASTGWETMLEGLLAAGFQITGTWPMRTEMSNRSIASGSNALASSIVLVCRARGAEALVCSRGDFLKALRGELKAAIATLQSGSVAPVDLAQAAIGPGMAIYSRYAQVLEPNGARVGVRAALGMINSELDAFLEAQEGELDPDTRFCVSWFENFGHEAADFGVADTLARAKATSVAGLTRAGVVESRAGRVRLLPRGELPEDWNPETDERLTVWEATQHLIRTLNTQGEAGAARLLHALGGSAEDARALAYRLFAICERKGWTQEALAYNTLVASWSDVQTATIPVDGAGEAQAALDFDTE